VVRKADPKSTEARVLLGNLYRERLQHAAAIQTFKSTVADDLRRSHPAISSPQTYALVGKLDDARTEYRKVVELQPKFTAAARELAALSGPGDRPAAHRQPTDLSIGQLKEVVRQQPRNAWAHVALGRADVAKSPRDRGGKGPISIRRSGSRARPTSWLRSGRGPRHARQGSLPERGEYGEAVSFLKGAALLLPQNPTVGTTSACPISRWGSGRTLLRSCAGLSPSARSFRKLSVRRKLWTALRVTRGRGL
jgi:tetratricopeptide (TPR) repeat protein